MNNGILIWFVGCLICLVTLGLASFMARAGYGDAGMPGWMVELLMSYFWHSFVFVICARLYMKQADRHEFLRGKQLFFGWLFTIYLSVVLVLRFVLDVDYRFAYTVPIVVCVYFPFYVYLMWYPVYAKKADLARISPKRLLGLVKESPQVQAFLRCFADVKAYAYQIERKHHEAKCVFMHRRKREERDEMYEDIVLEVAVDLDAKPQRIVREELTRYLFQEGEEGSAVVHLPSEHEICVDAFQQPLEEIRLIQIDTAFERYPLLGGFALGADDGARGVSRS